MTKKSEDWSAIGEALSRCLVESDAEAVNVEGLGVFHVRDRGPRGKGVGLLYVLAPEMRTALGGYASEMSDPAALSFTQWLGKDLGDPATARNDVDAIAKACRDAIAARGSVIIPSVGTLSHVITTPKNLIERDGSTRRMEPRPSVAFVIAPGLKDALRSTN